MLALRDMWGPWEVCDALIPLGVYVVPLEEDGEPLKEYETLLGEAC